MSEETLSVHLPSTLPIKHQAEILVAGAGPGGLSAAVAAARAGRDVLLAEQYGFPGGMAASGEISPFMQNGLGNRCFDEGIYTEWVERMARYGGLHVNRRTFDPNAARLAAEDMLLESGVRLLYHHRLVHVETVGANISGVVLHSKGGLSAARAQIYIDSTGDGDLAALAGCPFEYGSYSGPHAQPMSLCFKLAVTIPDFPRDAAGDDAMAQRVLGEHYQVIQDVFLKAKAEGRIDLPRENVLMFRSMDPSVIHFNSTRVVHKSAIDGDELSQAEIEGRRQLRQLFDLLRAEVPLFKDSRIYSMGFQIGVRESRRILGRYYLTRDDFLRAAQFPDGIARANYPMDIHSVDGVRAPGAPGTEMTRVPKGKWYEIPYRCLVPQKIENLLIGSRCISADHGAHGSLRVMPIVCSIGQAAGTAAAIAIEESVSPAEVDGVELRQRLIRAGRNL